LVGVRPLALVASGMMESPPEKAPVAGARTMSESAAQMIAELQAATAAGARESPPPRAKSQRSLTMADADEGGIDEVDETSVSIDPTRAAIQAARAALESELGANANPAWTDPPASDEERAAEEREVIEHASEPQYPNPPRPKRLAADDLASEMNEMAEFLDITSANSGQKRPTRGAIDDEDLRQISGSAGANDLGVKLLEGRATENVVTATDEEN
jgi:hypothetical protein